MATSIMDKFLNKMSTPPKSPPSPFLKKLSGSQGLFDNSARSYHTISREIHADLMGSNFSPEKYLMSDSKSSDSGKNNFHVYSGWVSQFQKPAYSTVSSVSPNPTSNMVKIFKDFSEKIQRCSEDFTSYVGGAVDSHNPHTSPRDSKVEMTSKRSESNSAATKSDADVFLAAKVCATIDSNVEITDSNSELIINLHTEISSNKMSVNNVSCKCQEDIFVMDDCIAEMCKECVQNNCVNAERNAKNIEKSQDTDSVDICAEIDLTCMTISESTEGNTVTRAILSVKSQSNVDVNNITLNKEMADRKSKQMQKKSKKRRRRQKKKGAAKKVENPKKQEPKSEEKNVSHMPPTPNVSPIKENVSCDILCDMVELSDEANSVQIGVSSFFYSVDSTGDEDSDWDSCDRDWADSDPPELEFTGLFVASFTTPTTVAVEICSPPSPELYELSSLLRTVNKKWNEAMKDVEGSPKVSTKVSFGSEDEVFPVDVYDRKGEWEIFALARFRFQRRVADFEKIINPCLSEEHRANVYQKLTEHKS